MSRAPGAVSAPQSSYTTKTTLFIADMGSQVGKVYSSDLFGQD